jgi:membrane-associated phospholipid phosphatase
MATDREEATGMKQWTLMSLGLCVAWFAAVGALAIDHHVARWAAGIATPVADVVVGVLNPLGSGLVPLAVCAVAAALGHVRRRSRLRSAGTLGALAFVVAGLVEFTLKHLVGRYRPDAAMPVLAAIGPTFTDDIDSFPSGHATSVFAVATAFADAWPRLAWLFYALAVAIAAGRVYLARHYLSDVLGGAVIGIAVSSAIVWTLAPHHRTG